MTTPNPQPPPATTPPAGSTAAATTTVAPSPLTPRLKRHVVRGVLAGLMLGLGLALLVLVYGKAPFGIATPYVCLGAGLVAGVCVGLSGPARRR